MRVKKEKMHSVESKLLRLNRTKIFNDYELLILAIDSCKSIHWHLGLQ